MRSRIRVLLFCVAAGVVAVGAVAVRHRFQGNSRLLSQPGPAFVVKDAELPEKLRIIVYGDMRFTDPADTKAANPAARMALVAKIAEEHPDALVLTGDVPYRGSFGSDYAEYRKETAAWKAEELRVYPALGNHELKSGGPDNPLENWWAAFPQLKDRRWYGAALGSRVYLICLDSNSDLTAGSEQQRWLAAQLAHLPESVDFVFLALHHPPVADIQKTNTSHNPRPNEIALRDFLARVAPTMHARLIVAAAHVHNYERFEQGGVTYLVSGGGGAHPYAVERTPADLYQATDFPNFHFVVFQLDGQKMDATMVRLALPIGTPPQWQTRDTFAIEAK
jgi:acid phosphatase type 7